ncbi:toxin-antitoxin system, toxin component, Bro domain protein [Clostridium perfringens]|uniref:Toxin-antitoxin system, toxin component, Bro domain protein n=2 Tax=Clostridium perfringens TaxID=1502 RepID=A0A133MN00_CLOPF|nr:toxin-antitoxin system, toxin component, Bro domain protein [Clostridium perfringens]
MRGEKYMINKIMLKGQQEIMGIKVPVVEGGFGEGQKVMLAKTIAQVHNMELSKLNELINSNLKEFENEVDILDLIGILDRDTYIKNQLLKCGYTKQSLGSTVGKEGNIYLLSQRGYVKLVAMMSNSNEKKWEVMNYLIDDYFSMKAKQKSDFEDLSPELQMSYNLLRAMEKQEKRTRKLEEDVSQIKDVMLSKSNTKNWRKTCKDTLVKTAAKMGGVNEYLGDLYTLSYTWLEERLHISLDKRLHNARKRMIKQGATKTEAEKLNALDIIENDKKLIEPYIQIVKEIGVKYSR